MAQKQQVNNADSRTDQQTNERQNRYFSESFKKQKVKEIERNLITMAQVCSQYEVSRTAVYKWIYNYSAMKKKGIRQVVEPLSDTKKIIHLEQKIKDLEQMVGRKQIELEFLRKLISLAEQHYDIDIKKNFGSTPSTTSGSTEKNTPSL